MSEAFHINAADPMPLYAQLERAIRFAIATGKLRVGDQLPTVRQLAVDLRINANTVAKVYAELERAGVLETRRGVGTFVCAHDNVIGRRSFARKVDREQELRRLTDRFLAEALAHGFSLDEVVDHLRGRRGVAAKGATKEKNNHG
ncbi:MAG TPA: GntR family transcriptional regulator [Blastocatellia bacterium]|nr:GntR family transcriptional regulator [Blastocatellia bacterium]